MQVIEHPTPEKATTKVRCTGSGNGGGGCGALLAITPEDVFITESGPCFDTEAHKTFACCLCEVWTDVDKLGIPANGEDPKSKAAQEKKRAAFREEVANLCHEQWSGWMKYLHPRILSDLQEGWEAHGTGLLDEGIEEMFLSLPSVMRYRRQMETPYAELSEPEKESDRIEADKFFALFKQ